jgi:micrococcal nuclease
MRRTSFTFALLVGCATLLASSLRPAQAAGRKPSDLYEIAPQAAHVTAVIDGDTIQVEIEGAPATVRYIGVDAPALNECYGAVARNFNASLVEGQTVRLETDAQDLTVEGTSVVLLRYVYLLDGRMLSEELARGGYARAVVSQPNLKHQADLNNLEAPARAARRGGWGACGWKSSVAALPKGCATIAAETLAEKVRRPQALRALKDGDCVTIVKAQNAEGPAWSGQFIYRPAGTVLKLSDMYLRWKDSVTMIKVDGNGTAVATVVEETWWDYTKERGLSPDGTPGSRRVTAEPLARVPNQPDILQIESTRTWLLRDAGQGNYAVLVDAFVYQSGDMQAIYYGLSNTLH